MFWLRTEAARSPTLAKVRTRKPPAHNPARKPSNEPIRCFATPSATSLQASAQRPQVASVIAGATRVEQVEQNVKAIGWTLSAEDMAAVDQMTK